MKENKSKSNPYQNYRLLIGIIVILIMAISGLAKLCTNRETKHLKVENQTKYSKKIFNKNDSTKLDSLNTYLNE